MEQSGRYAVKDAPLTATTAAAWNPEKAALTPGFSPITAPALNRSPPEPARQRQAIARCRQDFVQHIGR